MLKINIKPLARQDLLGIWQYSNETWGNKQADLYLQELDATLKKLSNSPKLGRAIDEVRENMGLIPCKQHIIIYQIKADSIDIVRVLHKRMDIKRHAIQ